MAATVFTISCGEDGADGKDGASCTVQQTSSGYDVLCGSEKVGELPNVAQGNAGPAGPAGPAGNDGVSCVLGNKQGSSYTILCGGQPRGTLDGCQVVSDDPNVILFDCGSTSVGVCNVTGGSQQAFNPEMSTCKDNSGTVSLVSQTGTCTVIPSSGTAVTYQKATQYCGYADKSAYDSKTVSALPLCGDGKPNDETTTEWKDEYCRASRTVDEANTEVTGTTKYITTFAVSQGVLCDGDTIYPEKVMGATSSYSWVGNYCGYNTATDLKRTMVTGICDDNKGPYEEAFNFGYCQRGADAKGTVKVSGAEAFCGNGRVAANRINEGSWKYEYCGYEKPTALVTGTGAAQVKKVTGLLLPTMTSSVAAIRRACAALSPNADSLDRRAVANGGNYATVAEMQAEFEYCQVDKDGNVKLAKPSENTCATNINLNELEWKGQWCGYTNQTANAPSLQTNTNSTCATLGLNSTKPADANDVEYCQVDKDGKAKAAKPSDNDCADNGVRINQDSWKAEYCGFKTATSTKKEVVQALQTQIPLPATGEQLKIKQACFDLAPNITQPEGATNAEKTENFEYCQVDPDGKVKLAKPSDNDCNGANVRLNEGKWNGEYCGYANANASTQKTKLTLAPSATVHKLCGALGLNSSKPNSALEVEYCQVPAQGADPVPSTEYCNNAAANKLNEGSWKNQYCVPATVDASGAVLTWKVQACQGGLVGNTTPVFTSGTTLATVQCHYPD